MDQGLPLRFYYSQTFWVDAIRQDSQGRPYYRVNPNYYGGVDLLWADAEAFRPITTQELTPINPDATDKSVVIDVTHQTLSCFEGSSEVYFCRVSTGAKYDMYGNVVDKWATPVGKHRVTRKYISLQMSGGTTAGLPCRNRLDIHLLPAGAIHSPSGIITMSPVSWLVLLLPEDYKWVCAGHPEVVSSRMLDVTVADDSTWSWSKNEASRDPLTRRDFLTVAALGRRADPARQPAACPIGFCLNSPGRPSGSGRRGKVEVKARPDETARPSGAFEDSIVVWLKVLAAQAVDHPALYRTSEGYIFVQTCNRCAISQ
jgi:hypothetical protein